MNPLNPSTPATPCPPGQAATAVIADDEPFMRRALIELLAGLWPELRVVSEAEDGPSALMKIESLRPDIAFLDIRMPGMTGLEVARALTVASRVVFVTAFENHAVEAFEANAVDYVLKPLEPARLARVIAKLRRALAAGEPGSMVQVLQALGRLGVAVAAPATAPPVVPADRLEWLQVAVGQQIRMLHVDDVMYFEADTKYTRVVAEDCDGLIRTSLKEVLENVGGDAFMQTHRSMVVNRRYIRSVHRRGDLVELELKGRPERLKVSVANHHMFKAM